MFFGGGIKIIDCRDNNDQILSSKFLSKSFLFQFMFGGRIKIIDQGDNNDRILLSKLFL